MLDQDQSVALREQVQQAVASRQPLMIVGGNTKQFLGQSNALPTQPYDDNTLRTVGHSGVVSYEPTELVVTVRAGTSMQSLVSLLSDNGQMLPFEPPVFEDGTIGGVLACGLSGPARPFTGSARDYVLGMRVINGKAQELRFGGEVMKNVAGYDAARLHVGAFGTLGVLLETSMKVLPKPESEVTVVLELAHAFDTAPLQKLMRQPLPLSAAMIDQNKLYLRLSGSEAAVMAASKSIGGDSMAKSTEFWAELREMQHRFFCNEGGIDAEKTLWRISVPDFTEQIAIPGDWIFDWAGAQRFLKTDAPANDVFSAVEQVNGHATCYSPDLLAVKTPAFQPLTGAMATLQTRVRDSFDVHRLFNVGRFHPELDDISQPNAASMHVSER